jgi:CubicO group peptidase (beta-lactamase class C family)
MQRRTFLGTALAVANASSLFAALPEERWDDAAKVFERATAAKQVEASVLHVVYRGRSFTRHFGKAASDDAMFLLSSISKPINMTAVVTLYDQGKFQLNDRVKKFLPAFTADGRDKVTIRHLLTHVSGLPDQLANNNELRKQHAPLTKFAGQVLRTRPDFAPGTKYQYSSMGILFAARIAELISGSDIRSLVDRTIFQPLSMKHSAQGPGRFKLEEMVSCQREGAAPESGRGDPQAKEWDWNSPYWRKLGAPWGGTHASAPDIATVLGEFLGLAGRSSRTWAAAPNVRGRESKA